MAKDIVSRVHKHRETLRERGLRPLQIWVPDVRSPFFLEECRRQSSLVAHDPAEATELAWAEAVAERAEWE